MKTASLKLIRRVNPEIKSTAILKSIKDLYRKQLKQARAEEILKKMSEKRGIGADLTEALTEDNLQMAIRRLGYTDTVPSLEEVQHTYSRLRMPKSFPSEPLVDEHLTKCVLNQSWPGMTVATSLNKGAGLGVFATLPFYKNQVVVEYHGRRMDTNEANRLLQSLLGEDDGSNYFLRVDQDVTIDAREKVCTCHPHQKCFGRLVNHKAKEDDPNLKCKALVVDGLKIPFLVATRDITAGEELCFDYGVRPGQFNEGYAQMFLLPEKSRKRKISVLMESAMDKTQEEARSEEPQMDTNTSTHTATDTEPQTQSHTLIHTETHSHTMEEMSEEARSSPSKQTPWWDKKLNENNLERWKQMQEIFSSDDETMSSSELSVIFHQVAGTSSKKTKQLKIDECGKGFEAVAKRLSATQEGQQKKRRKKKNKKSKGDHWEVSNTQ